MKVIKAGKRYVFPAGSQIPLPAMIFGYFLIFMGIGYLGEIPYLAMVMLLLGAYLGFQGQGAEVDLEQNKMRVYTSYLSVRIGKWRNLKDFPFISVVRRKTSERTFGMSANYVEVKKSFHSVCLLNKSHHTRIVLVNIEGEQAAIKAAKELANTFNLEYTMYNPALSEASKVRRDRRR